MQYKWFFCIKTNSFRHFVCEQFDLNRKRFITDY